MSKLLGKGGSQLTVHYCVITVHTTEEWLTSLEEDSSLAENIPLIHIYHIKHIHIRHVTVSG